MNKKISSYSDVNCEKNYVSRNNRLNFETPKWNEVF